MLNVVALMGRLVADPELRHTPNGVATCTFRIAVDRSFVRAGEERKADFIDIVVWRQTAEFVCKYFHKGNLIAVDGSIQTRTYEDKTGNKRYAFEVVANNVHFTGEKSGSTGGQGGYGAPAPMQAPAARPAPAEPVLSLIHISPRGRVPACTCSAARGLGKHILPSPSPIPCCKRAATWCMSARRTRLTPSNASASPPARATPVSYTHLNCLRTLT